ncbi:helicase-associated domain-containing protein, partial [Crossiella equi]
YDTWRARPPAARWVTLARAWLRLEEAPTHRVRADGKPVPPPLPNPGPAARQRAALLRLYAELPEDRGVADPAVLDRLAWQLPLLAAATAHLRAVAEAVLAEARLLGLVAGDQLSPAGRALLDADDPETPIDPGSFDAGDGLLAAAATLLPGTTDRVLLQSDLTAVAAGDPGQHLVRLLDTAADVESSGAARIWRFSAATVRRALDTGKSADQLIDALHAVAPDGLPQPLEYLIRDVARQHGSVRVLDAGCLVLAQDGIQALEIMNSPAADWLGLRQVADAVLLSPRPRPDTLGRLRRAGFLPVGQDSQGTDQPEDPVPTRGLVSTKTRYRPRTADPDELLAALAASPDEDPYDPEVHLRTAAPELPLDDRLRLAEAVRRGLGVEITYPMPDGTGTARPVSDLALERGTLLAWCHRHHTEALFDLARITRVGVPGAVRLMAESGPNRYP